MDENRAGQGGVDAGARPLDVTTVSARCQEVLDEVDRAVVGKREALHARAVAASSPAATC